MRRDQYPAKPCFRGSGLPIPLAGCHWISCRRVLILARILRSVFCQYR